MKKPKAFTCARCERDFKNLRALQTHTFFTHTAGGKTANKNRVKAVKAKRVKTPGHTRSIPVSKVYGRALPGISLQEAIQVLRAEQDATARVIANLEALLHGRQ